MNMSYFHVSIDGWGDLSGKRVFLRADLNVPLDKGNIIDDFRIRAVLPTIDLLLEKNATIILATHLGRPHGYDVAFSVKPLVAWLRERSYDVTLVDDPQTIPTIGSTGPSIIMLENLRFFSGEKSGDLAYAQQLAKTAEFYVDDAFSSLHRNDTSIAVVPHFFPVSHKSIGLLVQKELATFEPLMVYPQGPVLYILGGGKVTDKLPFLEKLIMQPIDSLMLCPALIFTFLKAQGKPVGLSLVDDSLLDKALEIIKKAHERNIKLIFPVDFLIAYDAWKGLLAHCSEDNFPENGIGVSIGPRSVKLFIEEIYQAKTIFLNAAMGDASRPETLEPLHEILKAVAHADAYSVVGGGDSVAAVYRFNLEHEIDHCSTGGGSALALLSGEKLPGLESLLV